MNQTFGGGYSWVRQEGTGTDTDRKSSVSLISEEKTEKLTNSSYIESWATAGMKWGTSRCREQDAVNKSLKIADKKQNDKHNKQADEDAAEGWRCMNEEADEEMRHRWGGGGQGNSGEREAKRKVSGDLLLAERRRESRYIRNMSARCQNISQLNENNDFIRFLPWSPG